MNLIYFCLDELISRLISCKLTFYKPLPKKKYDEEGIMRQVKKKKLQKIFTDYLYFFRSDYEEFFIYTSRKEFQKSIN